MSLALCFQATIYCRDLDALPINPRLGSMLIQLSLYWWLHTLTDIKLECNLLITQRNHSIYEELTSGSKC